MRHGFQLLSITYLFGWLNYSTGSGLCQELFGTFLRRQEGNKEETRKAVFRLRFAASMFKSGGSADTADAAEGDASGCLQREQVFRPVFLPLHPAFAGGELPVFGRSAEADDPFNFLLDGGGALRLIYIYRIFPDLKSVRRGDGPVERQSEWERNGTTASAAGKAEEPPIGEAQLLKRGKSEARGVRIVPAREEDLSEIVEIYAHARREMIRQGNPGQWGDSYPSSALTREDWETGRLYVVRDEDGVCAVFVFSIGEEPTYRHIEAGDWLSDAPYGTLHRVASAGRRRGVFPLMVEFCAQRIGHLRIDTHADNARMRRLIVRAGFRECGIIRVRGGAPRIAYERLAEN